MSFDTAVPQRLKNTQKWFASIITRPIDEDSKMNPVSPSGMPMEKEAWTYIAPSPTLQPAQRIQLYNQQYWWRLLSTLQENCPLVVRLFGFHDFNVTIATPYLDAYPSTHWSLNSLGRLLPKWIEESYHASDKTLVLNAARLDDAYAYSFTVKQLPPLDMDKLPVKGDISSLLDRTIYLQPHIHLFTFDRDLLNFRYEFLKQEPDYWVDNDFPTMEKGKEFFFVIYRNHENNVAWTTVGPAEYALLSQFKNGTSIEKACEWLEGQKEFLDEAMQNLPLWFKKWASRQWLSLG